MVSTDDGGPYFTLGNSFWDDGDRHSGDIVEVCRFLLEGTVVVGGDTRRLGPRFRVRYTYEGSTETYTHDDSRWSKRDHHPEVT